MRPSPDAPNRVAALDGMRFLAALSVVIFHLLAVNGLLTGTETWGRPSDEVFAREPFLAASYGWVGVPLFFMISGFVICMSSWGRTPGQFAVSRFVRLFPAYWVCIALTTVVATLHRQPYDALDLRSVLVNLTMLQEPMGVKSVDNVYWTLWVELRFYLLFALVIWRGLTYRSALTFCVIWAIVSAWAAGLGQPALALILIYGQSHYFIAGIVLFLMYKRGPHLALWLMLGLSWLMSLVYYQGNPFQLYMNQGYKPAVVLITLCYGVLILLALGKLNWLRWRGLTVLGATTYPLYLLHDNIGQATIHYFHDRVSIPPGVLLTIVIVALIVLSWLVHRLVERPLAPVLKRALRRQVASYERRAPRAASAPTPPVAPGPEAPPVVPNGAEPSVAQPVATGAPTQRPARHAAAEPRDVAGSAD